jgi:hypothetical protein
MRRAALWLALYGAAIAQSIDVGGRKQLFIDSKFIEASEGIRITAHQAWATGERILVTDAPWESDTSLGSYSTVLEEGGKLRLWYHVMAGAYKPGTNPPFLGVAYAESSDGTHFRKPVLGLVERNGTRENNLVMPTDPKLAVIGGGSVQRDENPACPPERRYKSWTKYYSKPGAALRGPHRVWYSADGLRWRVDERPVTGLRAADTQPSWFWDPRINRYVGYSREWVREKEGFGARMASYNESDDMLRWESSYMALFPDQRDLSIGQTPMIDMTRIRVQGENVMPIGRARGGAEANAEGQDQVLTPTAPVDFYGPGVFPYEGVYLAAISMFYHWSGERHESWPSTADVHLAVSRDGRHFMRPGRRQALLRTGRDGSFDSKWVWMMPRPIRRGGELWIYYIGSNRDHADRVEPGSPKLTAVSRAILRLDGFVSAEADFEGGWMLTPPITFRGSRLTLNLDTGAGGSARVEILEESGKPIPGFTIFDSDELNTNSVRKVVSWGGNSDVVSLAGKAVRLRFRMRAAHLYAFQFE